MKTILSPVVLTCLYLAAWTGCDRETCETPSAQIELELTFSGFDLSEATWLEFESVVMAPGPSGSTHDYFQRRVGAMAFPLEGRGGTLTLRVDPGAYASALVLFLGDEAEFSYDLTVRVFGPRDGVSNLLLAEGRLARSLSPIGCYLSTHLTVSAASTCQEKQDGDPCVGSGTSRSTCKCLDGSGCVGTAADGLTCEPSLCGDGYTDRRQGELCEPGWSGGDCDDNCLPRPIQVEVSTTSGSAALAGTSSISNTVAGDTVTHALAEINYSPDATPVAMGSILISDLDGDSAHELAWAFPEGYAPQQAARIGKVSVSDWPLIGSSTIGDVDDVHATLLAQPLSPPYWFGAALAAGDLNGDGTRDLVVGAPGRGERAGALFVFFSGTEGAITPSAANGYTLSVDTSEDAEKYMLITGTQGDIAGDPGDHLGYALAAADFNGDGITDLAVGAPRSSFPAIAAHGAVYLVPGKDSLGPFTTSTIDTVAHLTFFSYKDDVMLGTALATGDLDGDGYDDLIMGSQATSNGNGNAGYGAVYVVFGGPGLFGSTELSDIDVDDSVSSTVDLLAIAAEDEQSPLFGIGGAAAVADVDNDGLGELAVTLGHPGSVLEPSSVLLIRGTAFARYRETGETIDLGTLQDDGDGVWLHTSSPEGFGTNLYAADLNGDRITDLAISAPRRDFVPTQGEPASSAGAVYVMLGSGRARYWDVTDYDVHGVFDTPPQEVRIPWIRLQGTSPNGFFGASVAASSHLGLTSLETIGVHTYVLDPGWTHPIHGENAGRIWGLYLPALLPCGLASSCPRPTAAP